MSKIKSRKYQKDSKTAIIKELNAGKDVIYQLPTGGGKTVIVNDVVRDVIAGKTEIKTKKILILIHRREIIFQMYERFNASGIDAGYLVGAHQKNTDATVLIASIQTIVRDKRLEAILKEEYNLIVIDEAHHSRSGSYDKVLKQLKEKNPEMRLLGVTATPNRNDKRELIEHFDVMVKGPSIQELQDLGFLAGSVTYLADLTDLEENVESGADYKMSELSAYMRNPDVINQAITLYEEKAKDKQMLVFCVDKAHLQDVESAYIKKGYTNIANITSDTPTREREAIIENYKKGTLQIIVSVETLTEGTDLPDTRVVQLLRPTKSQELYLQIVGRGLRPKADGSKLIVLDIANCSKEHGLCDSNRTWSLDSKVMKMEKDNKIIVGRRADGTYTDDIEEITVNFLDVEEMTREEFILKSSNGIEVAENSNNKVKEEVAALINKAGEEIEKILGEWTFKKYEANDVDDDMKYNTLKFKMKKSDTEAITLKLDRSEEDKNPKDVILGEDRYEWKSKISKMDWWVILGKLVEVVRTKKLKNIMNKLDRDAKKKFDSLVNISKLKSLLEEQKVAALEIKINQAFENGIHTFEFESPIYGEQYNRNFNWSRSKNITFIEKKKKVVGYNKVNFGGEEGYLTKEKVLDLFSNEEVIW